MVAQGPAPTAGMTEARQALVTVELELTPAEAREVAAGLVRDAEDAERAGGNVWFRMLAPAERKDGSPIVG
jgi:hypothetical protein